MHGQRQPPSRAVRPPRPAARRHRLSQRFPQLAPTSTTPCSCTAPGTTSSGHLARLRLVGGRLVDTPSDTPAPAGAQLGTAASHRSRDRTLRRRGGSATSAPTRSQGLVLRQLCGPHASRTQHWPKLGSRPSQHSKPLRHAGRTVAWFCGPLRGRRRRAAPGSTWRHRGRPVPRGRRRHHRRSRRHGAAHRRRPGAAHCGTRPCVFNRQLAVLEEVRAPLRSPTRAPAWVAATADHRTEPRSAAVSAEGLGGVHAAHHSRPSSRRHRRTAPLGLPLVAQQAGSWSRRRRLPHGLSQVELGPGGGAQRLRRRLQIRSRMHALRYPWASSSQLQHSTGHLHLAFRGEPLGPSRLPLCLRSTARAGNVAGH